MDSLPKNNMANMSATGSLILVDLEKWSNGLHMNKFELNLAGKHLLQQIFSYCFKSVHSFRVTCIILHLCSLLLIKCDLY